ncbi:MAG: nuclear transport factor 2 family protein [Acidimicrobiales bacterium]
MPDTTNGSTPPIERCLEQWHRFLLGTDPDELDNLLDGDCVFTSPIVFTPQEGKELTKRYLTAAGSTLAGKAADAPLATGDNPPAETSSGVSDDAWDGRFRYVREVREGNHAVLEFETTLSGKYVNGVDMITCNDEGRIVDFKVMIRPLQAVNAVHEQMRAMLERMSSNGG